MRNWVAVEVPGVAIILIQVCTIGSQYFLGYANAAFRSHVPCRVVLGFYAEN